MIFTTNDIRIEGSVFGGLKVSFFTDGKYQQDLMHKYSFGKDTVKAEVKEEPKDRESLIKELKKAIADNLDITEEDFCKLTKITKIVELETHRLPGAISFVKDYRKENK